jgi:Fe2+ or Zn2+ uptake regulation protein
MRKDHKAGITDFREACLKALRAEGGRITKQRLAVIDCFSKAKAPLSASQIFIKANELASPETLDKVSVYRTLEKFLELNLIHRVTPTGEYIACTHQLCRNVHHVLSRCTECQKVNEVHVPSEAISPLLDHMKRSHSFTPDSHLLHIDGTCTACSKRTTRA